MKQARSRRPPNLNGINRQLFQISGRLEQAACVSALDQSVGGRIIVSLFGKARRTFRAIDLLKSKGFVEEGWALCRVLMEVTVNGLYFLKNDPAKMARRFVHAQIIESMKRARGADFFQGTRLAAHFDRGAMEREFARLTSEYTQDEMKAIKKFGFTGLPFEQRANDVALGDMSIYYRLGSRNLHTFDPADAPAFAQMMGNELGGRRALLKHRRLELDATQNELLGSFSWAMNSLVGNPATKDLLATSAAYRAFCESAWGTKASDRSDADSAAAVTAQGGVA